MGPGSRGRTPATTSTSASPWSTTACCDHWESEALVPAVQHRRPIDFRDLGLIPRDVAFVDNRARVFLPTLRRALRKAKAPQLVKMRGYLRRWNGRRDQINRSAMTYRSPAVVFFDRFVEKLMKDSEQPLLGPYWAENAGLDSPNGHLRSIDNLAAPTYKFEYAGEQVLAAALHGHTRYAWLRHRNALFRRAAHDAAKELPAEQGSHPSEWTEAVETGEFSAQGAVSVQ